ncbi:TolC family protein [Helicobacter equorum]|uniref:OMP1068 n=1 Tax=Helicobacter equorum TaxID=361872 RepID=A0A1M4NH72_9HELI|nr:TolC family protein [Helicobacter equorum]SFZ71353.1 OMP1068 [Helicobacter equorum]
MRIMLFFLWIGIIHNVLGDSQSLYLAQDKDSNDETLQTIDVRSAWDIVVHNNDGLKAQDYNVQRAQKLALGSKLSYLPDVRFSGAYLYFDNAMNHQLTSPNIGSTLQLNSLLSALGKPVTFLQRDVMIGALNIVYPLYTGGVRMAGIQLAEIAKKDAQFALELKKLATFEEFISLYYGDVLAREIKEVLTQDYEATQLHYQNALNLQKSGQIARIEVLTSQVASDKSKNKLHQAQNASISANIALQTALDNKNITSSSKLILSQKPLQDEEYYVQKTLANYPALQSMDLKIESATQTTKIARGAFLPQVVGMGSYIVTNKQDSLLIQAIPTWYVGVGVSMPILTPNARIQKYQASKLAQLELESLKAQATKDLTLLVRRTYKEAVYAREEYKNLHSSIQLAEENLKLQQNAFKQGMATSTQVIDAQNMLQSTLIEQKTIAYKAIVALAKLLVLSDEIETFYQYQQ